MGDFDPIGWAIDKGSEALDVAGDAIHALPLSSEMTGALQSFVNGPLRDVANSPAGMVVLRAMATTIYTPIAWQIGPQLASFVFALPGLARGEDFWHAWFDEVKWRAEKTAEVLGADAVSELPIGYQDLVDKIQAQLPEDVFEQLSTSEIAHELGVSDWEVEIVGSALGRIPIPSHFDFNWPSGTRKGSSVSAFAGTPIRSRAYAEPTSVSPWTEYQGAKSSVAWTEDGRVVPVTVVTDYQGPKSGVAWTEDGRVVPSTFVTASPIVPASTQAAAGNVALIGVATLAAAVFVWFYVGKR